MRYYDYYITYCHNGCADKLYSQYLECWSSKLNTIESIKELTDILKRATGYDIVITYILELKRKPEGVRND